jgi:hypothetical protein
MIDIGIIACFELNLTNCQEEPLLFWNRDLSCLTVSVRELRKCVLSRSLKTTWPVELYEGPFLGLTKAKWSRLILFSHCISLLHIKEEWKWMKLCAVFKSHLDLLCVRWLKHIYSRIYTCCSPGGRLQTFFSLPPATCLCGEDEESFDHKETDVSPRRRSTRQMEVYHVSLRDDTLPPLAKRNVWGKVAD